MVISVQSQIACMGLSKRFSNNGESLFAYENISLEIKPSEFVCLLGPSGCGKTTLLKTIAGLELPSDGELFVGSSSADLSPQVSMVFQEQGLFPWMTVYDNLAFILENNPSFTASDNRETIDDILLKVGLQKFTDYFPHQLSGGMKQRVSIARAFVTHPEIMLMDEPFVFLDFQTRIKLHALLMSLWQSYQKTVVFVTHDIEEAVLLADRVFVMTARPGKIKEVIDIEIDRPRDIYEIRHTRLFLDYTRTITQLLKQEMLTAEAE